MAKRNKLKRILSFILAIILITLCVFMIIQFIWYRNLDHALQLETNGFVKDDVTMLSFGQSAAKLGCLIGAVISGLTSLPCIGLAFDIISL